MKYSDAFPFRWLAADDLDGDLTVTVSIVDPGGYEEFRTPGKATPDSKPVLKFKAPRGTKPLILNKTNWKTIGQVLGSDVTDDWAGQQITLYVAEVEAFGEMTMDSETGSGGACRPGAAVGSGSGSQRMS